MSMHATNGKHRRIRLYNTIVLVFFGYSSPSARLSTSTLQIVSVRMHGLLLGLLGALRLELGVVVVTGVGARHVVAVPVEVKG